MPDKILLKAIFLSALFAGVIPGIISLIPGLTWVAIMILMFFIAPFTLIYLKKLGLTDFNDFEKNVVISGIAGAIGVLGHFIVFVPFAFLLQVIFKIQSFLWIKVLVGSFAFLISTIILTALLSALLNAFSGFLTIYLNNILTSKK